MCNLLKREMVVVGQLLLCSGLLVTGVPYGGDVEDMYNSDYDSYNNNNQPEPEVAERVVTMTPSFVTEAVTMLVNEGDTARLSCQVDRLEGFVLLWKQGEEIKTVANQIIDKRYSLEQLSNGNILVINQVNPGDEGEYTCQISAYKPTELTHKITVRVRPVIETVPSDMLVVREGEPATLTCNILAGSPTPAITWRRKKLEEQTVGSVLAWKAVNRHNAGHYICEADNGFGAEPVTKEVKLEVHHVPHVSVEEEFLHTGDGEEVKLTCTIHCSPKCEVVWRQNGEAVEATNPQFYSNTQGPAHTLTILRAGQETFGDYSCTAQNNMGVNSATVTVSGLAQPATWNADSHGPWEDKFFLEWSTVSKTPVLSFIMEYRAEREFTWSRREVAAVPQLDNRWQGSITLDGLAPAARYEAKVAARNQYGYNNYSKPFVFATKGAAPLQQPSISAASYSSSSFSLLSLLLPFLFTLVITSR